VFLFAAPANSVGQASASALPGSSEPVYRQRHLNVSVGIHPMPNSQSKNFSWGQSLTHTTVSSLVDADGFLFFTTAVRSAKTASSSSQNVRAPFGGGS
jgi:hypothetical protein